MRQVSISRPLTAVQVVLLIVAAILRSPCAMASSEQAASPGIEHRLLATSKTSTMEREMNEAAEAGFHLQAVMGGETAFGGQQVVAIMSRGDGVRHGFAYKLLATSKTSTMQKELQAAADLGFHYRAQTVFQSSFGGDEVVVILERDKDSQTGPFDYKLLATSKTSTLQQGTE